MIEGEEAVPPAMRSLMEKADLAELQILVEFFRQFMVLQEQERTTRAILRTLFSVVAPKIEPLEDIPMLLEQLDNAVLFLNAETRTERVRADRFQRAIRWALGELDGKGWDLPIGRAPCDGKEPMIGRYYWRTELRRRAGME